MNRGEFASYILNNYVTHEEHPWADLPEYSVFRHPSNKKWFALIMNIGADKVGLNGGNIDVVNLKCEPAMIENFLDGKSIFRAYHMNKAHWITVIIDAADENKLKMLLDVSFELTK